jgi:hypothetical protein
LVRNDEDDQITGTLNLQLTAIAHDTYQHQRG